MRLSLIPFPTFAIHRLALVFSAGCIVGCMPPATPMEPGVHSPIDGSPPALDGSLTDAMIFPEMDGSLADANLDDAASPDSSSTDGSPLTPDATRPDAGSPDASPPSTRYDETVFMATHNSYSGHERDTIIAQLDRGVRFLEFDIHDNDFTRLRDYQVGHDAPGDEVELGGGNPTTSQLRPWLQLVTAWSARHAGHAPITIAIDVKDDLTDNPSYAAGGLAYLGDLVEEVFGARLLRADEVTGPWPSTASLRDRILVVLSGDRETRELYRHDRGFNPSVSINRTGRVVSVHDSGSGSLWYWTGQYQLDGSVEWIRHGRYDSGTTPAVALLDDGTVVEVHRSESRNRLFYRVGILSSDYEINWGPSQDYDDGATPTLERLSDGRIRERHNSPSGDRVWQWSGSVNRTSRTVRWTDNIRSSGPLFNKATSTSGARRVETLSFGSANTLLYSTSRVSRERIRYPQVIFVERQGGDRSILATDSLRFFAASAGDRGAIMASLADGLVSRAWGFNDARSGTTPPANFPATDEPHAVWYSSYIRSVGGITY